MIRIHFFCRGRIDIVAEIPDQRIHIRIGIPHQTGIEIERQTHINTGMSATARISSIHFGNHSLHVVLFEETRLIRKPMVNRNHHRRSKNIEFISVNTGRNSRFEPWVPNLQRTPVDMTIRLHIMHKTAAVGSIFNKFIAFHVALRIINISLVCN